MRNFLLLNQSYIEEIKKIYKTEYVTCFFDSIRLYNVKMKTNISVLLPLDDIDFQLDISLLLETIKMYETNVESNNCYLCFVPIIKDTPSLFFDGKIFVHFVFYDINKKSLLYNNDFFYSGSRDIKKLQKIYIKFFYNKYRNQTNY